jgi:hypothetical protein
MRNDDAQDPRETWTSAEEGSPEEARDTMAMAGKYFSQPAEPGSQDAEVAEPASTGIVELTRGDDGRLYYLDGVPFDPEPRLPDPAADREAGS